MNGNPSDISASHEEFVTLFARHQRRVAAYIGTLLPNTVDAEEVMQETSITLWRKWAEFDRTADFVRWANGIAYRETLKHLRQKKRNSYYFSDELLALISAEQEAHSTWQETHHAALSSCLLKLPARDLELINLRYKREATAAQIAETSRRPLKSIYRSLERIRERLLECVQRTLAAGEQP